MTFEFTKIRLFCVTRPLELHGYCVRAFRHETERQTTLQNHTKIDMRKENQHSFFSSDIGDFSRSHIILECFLLLAKAMGNSCWLGRFPWRCISAFRCSSSPCLVLNRSSQSLVSVYRESRITSDEVAYSMKQFLAQVSS